METSQLKYKKKRQLLEGYYIEVDELDLNIFDNNITSGSTSKVTTIIVGNDSSHSKESKDAKHHDTSSQESSFRDKFTNLIFRRNYNYKRDDTILPTTIKDLNPDDYHEYNNTIRISPIFPSGELGRNPTGTYIANVKDNIIPNTTSVNNTVVTQITRKLSDTVNNSQFIDLGSSKREGRVSQSPRYFDDIDILQEMTHDKISQCPPQSNNLNTSPENLSKSHSSCNDVNKSPHESEKSEESQTKSNNIDIIEEISEVIIN